MSSLAAQLAQHTSLNTSLLADRSKRKPTASYLFTGKSADEHDLEAIHALAVNSLISLASIEPKLSSRRFEDVLFSEGAKDTDRTLLTPERVKEVDGSLEEFLALLGPYLMQPVVARILEWLVRRFRIHEFNVEAVIAVFLPYHESPQFAKMVTLLNIKPNTVFSFLLPYKSAALPLPRSSLVTEMLKNSDLVRFVVSLLPNALKKQKKAKPQVHRTLVVFNAVVLGEFIRRCELFSGRGGNGRKAKGVLDEGMIGMLLQALVEPLVQGGMGRDVVLGSYILLACLSQKCKRTISASALNVIISAIVASALSSVSDSAHEQDEQLAQSSTQVDQESNPASGIRADQVVKTLLAVCEPQEELDGAFENVVLKTILEIQGIEQALIDALPWEGSEKVLNPFIRGVVGRSLTEAQAVLESFISATNAQVPRTMTDTLTWELVNVVVGGDSIEGNEAVEPEMDVDGNGNGDGEEGNETDPTAGEEAKKSQKKRSILIAHRLLGLIYQRCPESLRRVGEVLAEDDEKKEEAFEQLVVGLSSVKLPASSSSSRVRKSKKGGSGAGGVDLIISASIAEPKARVKAVRELVRLVSEKGGRKSVEDMETIRSTLIARIQDTELGVLEVLYDQGTAPSLARLFVGDVKEYVASLSLALVVVKPSQSEKKTRLKMKRNVLRLHLTFLVNHLWGLLREGEGENDQEEPENTKGRELVFHEVIFPLLLFTKGRQKNVEVVWEILGGLDTDGRIGEGLGLRWLEGCGGIVRAGGEGARKEGKETEVEWMNRVNFGIAGQIAENITSSQAEHFTLDLDALVSKMRDKNVYVKLLAYVVVLVLLRKVEGERKVEVAEKIMCTLRLADGENGIEGVDDLSQEHLTLEKEDDILFVKYIVTKPHSKTSLRWMQIAVLAGMARIPLPVQYEELNWMLDSEKCTTNLGQRYIRLMRSIYEIANASTSLPILSSTILQLLFLGLKDNSLAFLSGIWASNFPKSNSSTNSHPASASASSRAQDEFKNSRAISLLHAAAFLEAHVLEEGGMDFQTVLPSLVVGLLSTATGGMGGEAVGVEGGQMQIRKGVFECLSRVRVLVEGVLKEVYKFDVIYGEGEGEKTLQYLDRNDLKRYLSALVEHRDHLMNDPSYLMILHEHHLGRVKGEKKKEAEYKHSVTCFLLSHANAFLSESGQIAILKSLARVQDRAKSEIMLPTIRALLSRVSDVPPADITLVASEELVVQLVACFDTTSAEVLNNDESMWEVFLRVVRTYLRSGTPFTIQKAVCRALTGGLFAALSGQRQVAVCTVLLEVGSNGVISQSCARTLLSDILNDVSLIVQLLDALAPAVPTSSPRAAKRVKITESTEDPLPHLSLLVEILGTKALPGSLDLTSRLLDTLNRVIQNLPATQADVVYISQLLMSAIESTSSKIVEVPNIMPNVIRIDVLVEVIRVSGNPQTFHQALLLISSLARLAPDSVLFHVMPVFTFMGSTVFHRDDSYSFKVVQQTIDGIVPVMVSSLRESHSQPLELYRAAKEFLRVFTDAAAHIPRHRRNYFFSHLIEVLGSRDFLPPICMLLLERSANRVVRQSFEEVKTTLALPITLFRQASDELQIHAATELLNEAQRLIVHSIDSNSAQPIFMECIPDGDHSISRATMLRRRAQALIIFVGLVLKPKKATTSSVPLQDGNAISVVITQLIALAQRSPSETKLDDISEAARSSLNRLLSSMSVTDFMDAVQTILSSGDVKVESGALEVLGKRLPDVSAKMRPAISDGIKKILLSIKNFLHIHKKGAGVIFAFEALKSVAMTLCSGEEGFLADVIPYLLSAMDDKELAAPSLATLASISVKLGPRVIPFFRSIISQCTTVLRGSDSVLSENAISTLQGLLKTIPVFWGNGELSQIIFLYMDQFSFTSNASSLPVQTLTKSLAKKIPPKALLLTLIEIWSPLQSSRNLARISAFFEVLKRSLQHADRPTVLDHLRELFKIFLDALDIVKADEKAEQPVISAFREMVVKLNESAFKPLFRRLHDWAFTGEPDNERMVIFGHLYINLLDFFKGLMVPYISFLLQHLNDILKAFKTTKGSDPLLWFCIIGIFRRALSYDDNAFWRDDKLRQLQDGLTSQIPVCMRLNHTEGRKQLQECLSALLDSITDDTLLKTVNLNVLMHTRSEDSRVRIFALSCAEVLWRSHGGRLIGFARETATFIAECGEDDNEVVGKAAFNLKDAVESVAGKLDGL